MTTNDALYKAATFSPQVSIVPGDTGPSFIVQSVSTLDGTVRNIQRDQIPMEDPYTTKNLWRYPAQGQYTTVIQSGGVVLTRMDRGSGSGTVEEVYIRMVVYNPNGTVTEYIPAPFWFQQLQWQTPAGSVIQQQTGTDLWLAIVGSFDYDQWSCLYSAINSSQTYQTNDAGFNDLAYTYLYIPVIGNWMACSKFFIPWVNGDLMLYITFQSNTTTLISGTDCQLSQLSVDMIMSTLTPTSLQDRKQAIMRSNLDFVFPYVKTQRFQQNLTAGELYQFFLNGLKGDVVFLAFILRPSLVGQGLYTATGINQFQLLNDAGIPISGAQQVEDDFDRKVLFPRWFLGQYAKDNHVYYWNFCKQDHGPLALLHTGNKKGAYTFTTNEVLNITTAQAGTNEVQAITTFNSTTGVNTLAAGGVYYFRWNTPTGSSVSAQVAYNATTTQMTTAIEDIPNFEGTVTPTNTYSAVTLVGFTFGGAYGNRPLLERGYSLEIVSGMNDGAGDYLQVTGPALSTDGVYGMTSGSSYTLDVYAWTTGIVRAKQKTGELIVSLS